MTMFATLRFMIASNAVRGGVLAVKIHPGIGVARVGNSPQTFIGPETVDIPPAPAGGYRDGEGLLRRQAARFRVFDGSTPVAGTTVSWTVTLQGGTQTITGASQIAPIVVGAATVAELQTDPDGNLLVLSCQIDSGGDNGCCDGPVQATVTVGTTTTTAVAAWVSIAPPDFAPGVFAKLPYQYLILDYLVSQGLSSAPPAATPISFRREIYPAIRGRSSLSPAALLALPDVPARTSAVPFYVPGPGEPSTIEGAYLHAVVEHFHSGAFVDDWGTAVPETPSELDRGPLTFVDASCPGWGWELGLLPLTVGANPFAAGETLRFAAGRPAGLTAPSSGWAADLPLCFYEWATVAQPPSAAGYGADWRLRGFMVQGGSGLVYQDWAPVVTLLTPSLDFGLVQRGSAGARSIDLELQNFYAPAPVEFIAPLPDGIEVLTLLTTTGTVPEAAHSTLHLTVLYKASLSAPLGPIPPATIELHVGDKRFFVPIASEIVSAETTQLALVLDCSYSMTEDRGDGPSKFLGLQQAVKVLVDAARAGDGIAIAPFSDDALPTLVAHSFGPDMSDVHRQAVRDFVDALAPLANTSIGDGLESGRTLLTETTDTFEHEALIVVTDGKQTAPLYIEDVSSAIRTDTFAVGIGTAANVDEDSLGALTGGRNGYLMLTGATVTEANRYRLDKYLLQILAGATNESPLLDPTGSVLPGTMSTVQIPVTEMDFRLDVMVVSDDAPELACALMGPDGTVRSFEALAAEPGVQTVRRPRLAMARVPTPLTQRDGRTWAGGTWHLLLAQRSESAHGGAEGLFLSAAGSPGQPARTKPTGRGKPISYAVVVNARSALRLDVYAAPREANSVISLEANVTIAGAPLLSAPSVVAEVTAPTGLRFDVPLVLAEPGRYFAEFRAVRPGEYATRFHAHGLSPRAFPFLREQVRTPAVTLPEVNRRVSCECSSPLPNWLSACGVEVKRLIACLRDGQPRKPRIR